MTPRGPRKPPPDHGTVNRYSNHACRCVDCSLAWSDFQRRRRSAKAGRPVADLPLPHDPKPGDGAVTEAVKARLETMHGTADRPALAAVAVALAEGIDNTAFTGTRAQLSRELRNVLGEISAAPRSRSRLTAVSELASRRSGGDAS